MTASTGSPLKCHKRIDWFGCRSRLIDDMRPHRERSQVIINRATDQRLVTVSASVGRTGDHLTQTTQSPTKGSLNALDDEFNEWMSE